MSAHHMEAQLIGYVTGLDGHTLWWGITVDSNGFQCISGCLNIDAVAGLEGELKDALIVQRRNTIVRYLCIPLTATD